MGTHFFALYNIKRDIKKRNTFLPLIMHSNITLMKKLQKPSPTIRTIYEICNLILRSDIVTKTKCAQKLLANICASRGPLLWVRALVQLLMVKMLLTWKLEVGDIVI